MQAWFNKVYNIHEITTPQFQLNDGFAQVHIVHYHKGVPRYELCMKEVARNVYNDAVTSETFIDQQQN
jgi:hypothetical protein